MSASERPCLAANCGLVRASQATYYLEYVRIMSFQLLFELRAGSANFACSMGRSSWVVLRNRYSDALERVRAAGPTEDRGVHLSSMPAPSPSIRSPPSLSMDPSSDISAPNSTSHSSYIQPSRAAMGAPGASSGRCSKEFACIGVSPGGNGRKGRMPRRPQHQKL